jgi:hypothetical protein
MLEPLEVVLLIEVKVSVLYESHVVNKIKETTQNYIIIGFSQHQCNKKTVFNYSVQYSKLNMDKLYFKYKSCSAFSTLNFILFSSYINPTPLKSLSLGMLVGGPPRNFRAWTASIGNCPLFFLHQAKGSQSILILF